MDVEVFVSDMSKRYGEAWYDDLVDEWAAGDLSDKAVILHVFICT